jgi:polo-like kinase 1
MPVLIFFFSDCRYTLLVGKPPFETSNLKDTYLKIKKNEYHIPSRVTLPAKNLIVKLLKGDPTDRPNMEALLEDEFFHIGMQNFI